MTDWTKIWDGCRLVRFGSSVRNSPTLSVDTLSTYHDGMNKEIDNKKGTNDGAREARKNARFSADPSFLNSLSVDFLRLISYSKQTNRSSFCVRVFSLRTPLRDDRDRWCCVKTRNIFCIPLNSRTLLSLLLLLLSCSCPPP
jgi:hypothetical protein